MTKRLLFLLPLLFVGCDGVSGLVGPDPAIPSEFTGSYTLVSLGGTTLPTTLDSFTNQGQEIVVQIVEGGIVLNLDGTLRLTYLEQHYVDGTPGLSQTITRDGTWVTDQEQIDVTWEGDATDYTTYLYDPVTEELWLDMIDAADIWRFSKND